jgi:methanogenic corrinoid protein MtbC1/DNA-binding XRE family transcriptional regulator
MEERQGSGSALARGYLDAIVRGDQTRADVLVNQARERGWSAPRIYLEVLAPAQSELGSLWRRKRLSVAQEHLATEITLHEMGRLRQAFDVGARLGARVVVTTVAEDTHAVGARMLADFLLMDGWTVDYLGANTPTPDLVDFVRQRGAALVALSVTRAEFLPRASEAAMALRRLVPPPKVLVGGAALRGRPRAAAALGADAVAADALSGMHEARKLVRQAAADAPPDYFERLGRRTQELRTARDWTQQQLAEAAGLDRTYISGLEHGKQNPTLSALLRLAAALQVPLERLLIFP